MGKNTHKVGSRGFKNGATINTIKGWKVERWKNFLTVAESGYRVLEPEWDAKVKGQTIITSNISKNAEPEILELQQEVKYVWNELLSDTERESVDILRIKYTDEPRWKKGRRGEMSRTLGSHGGRTVVFDEKIMLSPSVLTVHLAEGDKLNDVLNTVVHELTHARWAKEIEPNKEKMNKFTDKIIAMGKQNALTEYASSYFDDLEEVKKQDPADKDYTENVRKAEQLIANETHSEYFAMVGSPTERSYHTAGAEKLKAMSKMIKEDLYD